MSAGEDRFLCSVPAALRLVGAVRAYDPDEVSTVLAQSDLHALVVTLAAMVDDSRTPAELLAWTSQELRPRLSCDPVDDHSMGRSLALHGTRSRYNAGCRGEACAAAESDYQRDRHLRRKASALQAAS